MSLIKAGADPNVEGRDGKPPLILAREKSFDEIVRLLISRGADVNQTVKDGDTPAANATESDEHTE